MGWMSDETGLEKCAANHVPLTPLSGLRRAADVYRDDLAVVHGAHRKTYAEYVDRVTRLASALAAMTALKQHGRRLVDHTPRDIQDWCPGYARAPEPDRRAFWVGFLSTLAKHESRWRPGAVGGGGQWYGLLQILPATARGYGCAAEIAIEIMVGGQTEAKGCGLGL